MKKKKKLEERQKRHPANWNSKMEYCTLTICKMVDVRVTLAHAHNNFTSIQCKKKTFPKSKLINFFYNRGFSQVARFYFFLFLFISDAFSSSSSFFVPFLFYFGLVLPKVSIFSHRTFKGMLSNGKRCYIDTTPHHTTHHANAFTPAWIQSEREIFFTKNWRVNANDVQKLW